MKLMYNHVNPKNGKRSPLVAEDVYKIITDVSSSSCCSPTAHALLCGNLSAARQLVLSKD